MPIPYYDFSSLIHGAPAAQVAADNTALWVKENAAGDDPNTRLQQMVDDFLAKQRPLYSPLDTSAQPSGLMSAQSFVRINMLPATERVRLLATKWKAARNPLATVARQTRHPLYREIVAMGPVAVPALLGELRLNRNHWFVALHEITGASPVPEGDRGNREKMTEAWIKWGKSRGLIA